MHLHPEWQQLVLRDLKHVDAFPNIQFIVTTHSPQVLATVRKEHIRILESGSEFVPMPLAATFGETSNEVLETVMHTPFLVNSRRKWLMEIEDEIDRLLDDELSLRQLAVCKNGC